MRLKRGLLGLTVFVGLLAATPTRAAIYAPTIHTITAVSDVGGTPTTFASGFANAQGITFSPSGTMYVDDVNTGRIYSVSSTGVVTQFASAGLITEVSGLVSDTLGNLYVSDYGNHVITKISPTGQPSTYATGFNVPMGLAFDSHSNLFVADESAGQIAKVAPGGGVATVFAPFTKAYGVAVDGNGNVYASSYPSGTIERFSPSGTDLGRFGLVLNSAGLAFDYGGNLLVAAANPETGDPSTWNKLFYISPGGGNATLIASGVNDPDFVAVSPGTVVPEPSTLLGAITVGGAGLFARRRAVRHASIRSQ